MRSFLLISSTAAILFGLFVIYTRVAAPPPRAAAADGAMPTGAASGLSPSEDSPIAAGAWVNLYDKDGQVYGRLRSRLCTPEPDAAGQGESFLYHVTDPQGEFYQSDGRIVRLFASGGDVRMAAETRRAARAGGGPISAPSEGILRDVRVELYPGPSSRADEQPDMTIQLANVQFDADTYRLFTVAQLDAVSGALIPADQSPVTVRGRELDFDGRGLMLDWDAEAHELKSLLIEHGQRLVFKNTGAQDQSPAPRAAHSDAPAGPKTRPAPAHVYQATFAGGVRVVQDGEDRIIADEMIVTLAAHNEGDTTTSAPSHRASAELASAQPRKGKNSNADVFWSGPLTIVPADQQAGQSLTQGQAVVAFAGSPVHLHQGDIDVLAQTVQYATADGSARAVGGAAGPLRMALTRNGKPAGTVLAQSAQYTQNHVVMAGAGNGEFMDPAKPEDRLRVAWVDGCRLDLAGTGQALSITRADLQGSASVRDGPASGGPDKLRLTGDRIVADFIPSAVAQTHANRPESDRPPAELSDVIATGDAHCVIHDEKEADRTISTDKLTISMAKDSSGREYPRYITADGNALAQQDQAEIHSRWMDATVSPRAEGNVALQNLLASGDLRAKGKNGAWASGDALRIEERDGVQIVTLIGNPRAVVAGAAGTLGGPQIQAKPKEQWARIIGPGSIDCQRAAAQASPAAASGKAKLPVHVQWRNSAEIIGGENRVEVFGGVSAQATEASGAQSTAAADHAILYLAPTTRPGRESHGAAGDFDPLRDKQVRRVSLLGRAQLSSTLTSAGGVILRRSYIEGDRIDAQVQDQRLTVPGPGRMLMEDHAKTRHQADAADDRSSNQGLTAIRWETSFSFDQAAGLAVIEGPVRMVHWSDSPQGGATEVLSDHVTANFEHGVAAGQEPKLTDVQADGNVQITTFADKNLEKREKIILATKVTYDPVTQVLTAIGSSDSMVTVSDSDSGREETFEQVSINLHTNEFNVIDLSGQSR